MIEEIEKKMSEVVRSILSKPASDFTKSDYDILASEHYRLKSAISSIEHSKKMAEIFADLYAK